MVKSLKISKKNRISRILRYRKSKKSRRSRKSKRSRRSRRLRKSKRSRRSRKSKRSRRSRRSRKSKRSRRSRKSKRSRRSRKSKRSRKSRKSKRSRSRKSKRSRRSRKSKRSRSRRSKKIKIIKDIIETSLEEDVINLSTQNSSKVLNYENIYLNINDRVKIISLLKNELSSITKIHGSNCINGPKADLLNKIELKKLLGIGTFGAVYSACTPKPCDENSYKFAIKMSAFLNKKHYKNPFNTNEKSWYEFFILRDYLKPLVERKICPNLPLLIDAYLCDSCVFPDKKTKECIITLTEIADGDLDNWFNEIRSEDEIANALFQIMAAIHAIQYHCQIVNKDIKSPNVLFYNIVPGGYFHYVVHGKDFYVQNLGFLFILNDFGVSLIEDPKTHLRNGNKSKMILSTNRNFLIMNNKISPLNANLFWKPNDKNPIPIKSFPNIGWFNIKYENHYPAINNIISKGTVCNSVIFENKINDCEINFTDEQKLYLSNLNIPTNSNDIKFYEHPEIIPPYNFSCDTQDCIRIFTGGKRIDLFPPVLHKKYSIPTNILNKIKKYDFKFINNLNPNPYQAIEPSFYVAGYFIEKFFTEEVDYSKLPCDLKIIDTYKIS